MQIHVQQYSETFETIDYVLKEIRNQTFLNITNFFIKTTIRQHSFRNSSIKTIIQTAERNFYEPNCLLKPLKSREICSIPVLYEDCFCLTILSVRQKEIWP